MVLAPRPRLPTGHPVGWDLKALALFERELYGAVGIPSCMHDQVMGWDDEVLVDDDQDMTYGHAGSPRDARSSAGTDVCVVGARPSGDVNSTENPAVNAGVVSVSAISITGGRDVVSRFGSPGCAMFLSTDARIEERAEVSEVRVVLVPDCDFNLMYVRCFLREAAKVR